MKTSRPNTNITNLSNNRKYSWIGFLPMVLLEQFQYFFNLFFLGLCISQFIPVFQVGLLFSYVSPLVFVLSLTLLKEFVDECKRYIRDNQTNKQIYLCFCPKALTFVDKRCQDIIPGDILRLKAGSRVPADCLVLASEDGAGACYVRTDQLDGETDWKLRRAVRSTQKLLARQSPRDLDIETLVEPPHMDIYAFKGQATQGQSAEGLTLEHTLWNGTSLCSVGATVMVLFVGPETRINLNITDKRLKFGSLDDELNSASKLFFFIMLAAAIALQLMSGYPQGQLEWEVFAIGVVKYVLLISSIIPISLRVNLDFSKLLFCYRIGNDPSMPGAIARNSSIPEELGRIKFILSDKTGTITQNQMELKSLYTPSALYSSKEMADLKKLLKEYYVHRFVDDLVIWGLEGGKWKAKSGGLRDYVTALIEELGITGEKRNKWLLKKVNTLLFYN